MTTTNTTKAEALTREQLLALLSSFVNQRPGFDPMNYADAASYRSDQRTAQRQRADALAMLAYIGWNSGITAGMLRRELQGSGRLTLSDGGRLSYCTGQYWPTEFRAGVCRVLSSVIWDYTRANVVSEHGKNADNIGDRMRASLRREFGRGLASRWFR